MPRGQQHERRRRDHADNSWVYYIILGLFLYIVYEHKKQDEDNANSHIKDEDNANSYIKDGDNANSHIKDEDNANSYIKDELYSSVWCHHDEMDNKFCIFRNLCFIPNKDRHFIFTLKNKSTFYGLKSKEELKNISWSSVENHNDLFMKIYIDFQSDIMFSSAKIIDEPLLLFRKFKHDNIMHVVHDDIFPIFMSYDRLCSGNIDRCVNTIRLAFANDEKSNMHNEWYNLFSRSEPLNVYSLHETTCFRTIHVGFSRDSLWFQYGFKKTQGPITPSSLDSVKIEKFRKFILKGFGVSKGNKTTENVSVFSRKLNRRILNERDFLGKIQRSFDEKHSMRNSHSGLNLHVLDPSQNTTREILTAVQSSNYLIGMHGSAMIYSLFLLPGSAVIELFPFGIQPQHVSPTRALADLPHSTFTYLSWRNFKESNSIAYPERPALHGGIVHLSLEQQNEIKALKLVPPVQCCHNPAYLYRMFQDTTVDDSFNDVLKQIHINRQESCDIDIKKLHDSHIKSKWFFPGPVFDVICQHRKEAKQIHIMWKKPYNVYDNMEIRFHLNVHILSRNVLMTTTSTNVTVVDENDIDGRDIQLWIKCSVGAAESVDKHSLCMS